MADKTTGSNSTHDSTTPKKKTEHGDLGASQVQANFDKETDQGFRGVDVDPTPNENYTVGGVTDGKPTPETNADAAKTARDVTGGSKTAVEQNAEESK